MSGIDEIEYSGIGNFRNDRTKLASKFDLSFDEIELGDSLDSGLDRWQLFAQGFCKLEKNACDLAFFFALKILEFVIRFDRVERFDEDGRAA